MQKYYINLDERPDRREQFEAEMAKHNWQVTRFPAIKKSRGALGCALSHVAVLQKHLREHPDDMCLVMEDDFMWKPDAHPSLEFLSSLDWDVVVLAASLCDLDYNSTSVSGVHRLHRCQTTTCYLVHPAYVATLERNFSESARRLVGKRRGNEIDVGWKSLQARDKWYIAVPGWGCQRPGYSDIERKQVDYPFI